MGKLQGTCREHVPELTARGPLKIVLSGAVKLCLAPEREEGRAGRECHGRERPPLLHPTPLSFRPIQKRLRASWEQDPEGGIKGAPCEGG